MGIKYVCCDINHINYDRAKNRFVEINDKNTKRTYGDFSFGARAVVIVTGVIAQTFHVIIVSFSTCPPSDRFKRPTTTANRRITG